jgi:hypothetical protein
LFICFIITYLLYVHPVRCPKNIKIKLYRTIILSIVLYGCETWSLKLREERGLRVFEKWVLRRRFGSKRDEVTRECIKQDHEEIDDLYCSSKIIRVIKSRKMRWTGHVACMGERTGVYRVLVGKPEGMRPLGGSWRRWEDNIKMDLQEVRCGSMGWINLAQERNRWQAPVSVVMNLLVPYNAELD